MTNKEKFMKSLPSFDGKIIGNFINIHGEHFVVYTMGNLSYKDYYVTGDEFGWESSYRYFLVDNKPKLAKEFLLSNDELKKIQEIISEA